MIFLLGFLAGALVMLLAVVIVLRFDVAIVPTKEDKIKDAY